MAKRMTDEQKLFFGSKSQRLAMKKKHPSWARDKKGFRQTVNGKHRNPFRTKTRTKTRKTATRKTSARNITLASINAKIRKGLKLNAADSAWIRKHHPTDAYLGYTTPVAPGAPDYSKSGGGSSSWLTVQYNLAQAKAKAQYESDLGGLLKTPPIPGIGGLLGGSISGGKAVKAGKVVDVLTAGIPGAAVLSPQPERFDPAEILASNLSWMENNPGADPYGLLDPTYAIV